MQDGEVAGRRLVVAGGDSPKALEVVEESLYPVAQLVTGAVQGQRSLAAQARMDDRLHPGFPDVGADAVGACGAATRSQYCTRRVASEPMVLLLQFGRLCSGMGGIGP